MSAQEAPAGVRNPRVELQAGVAKGDRADRFRQGAARPRLPAGLAACPNCWTASAR